LRAKSLYSLAYAGPDHFFHTAAQSASRLLNGLKECSDRGLTQAPQLCASLAGGGPGSKTLQDRNKALESLIKAAQRFQRAAFKEEASSLSLFGSVARGETEGDSDIDLAAEFDPAARMDLLQLSALEWHIAELLGRTVDLLPEPVEKRRLQDQINRDRRRAF